MKNSRELQLPPALADYYFKKLNLEYLLSPTCNGEKKFALYFIASSAFFRHVLNALVRNLVLNFCCRNVPKCDAIVS